MEDVVKWLRIEILIQSSKNHLFLLHGGSYHIEPSKWIHIISVCVSLSTIYAWSIHAYAHKIVSFYFVFCFGDRRFFFSKRIIIDGKSDLLYDFSVKSSLHQESYIVSNTIPTYAI